MSSFPIWYMLIFLKIPPLMMIGLLFWAASDSKSSGGQDDDGGGGSGPCPDDGRRTPGGPVHARGCQGEKEREVCRVA